MAKCPKYKNDLCSLPQISGSNPLHLKVNSLKFAICEFFCWIFAQQGNFSCCVHPNKIRLRSCRFDLAVFQIIFSNSRSLCPAITECNKICCAEIVYCSQPVPRSSNDRRQIRRFDRRERVHHSEGGAG